MPKLLRQFTRPMPIWVNHVMATLFLNQDALFLHHQERSLHNHGTYTSLKNDPDDLAADSYSKAILPVETDLGVVTFRKWLQVFAGGRIPYHYHPTMPAASNEIVFDVWNAHTKHCVLCQTALTNVKKARLAAFVVAACLAVLRPFHHHRVVTLGGVLAAGGLGLALNKLVGMFYRFEFSHSAND
jgi:hypothetical protein